MKIAILHHKYTDLGKTPCLINHIAQHWMEQGHDVTHIKGVDNPLPAADVLIIHVNLTVVPQEYIHAAERYPVVINRNVIDISKPAFSQIMVKQNDRYSGPVIVKTSNNYGGIPERRLGLKSDGGANNLYNKICQKFDWLRSWRNIRYLDEYQVVESIQKVPNDVWLNEYLVVEKFLPERDKNGNYCVREWVFFGDKEIHFMNISLEPVIKSTNTIRKEYFPDGLVSSELRDIRNELGFGYGKFDYCMQDGKPILFDINKTPGISRNVGNSPRVTENIRQLSLGLGAYINNGENINE